ncbi:MAG: hypothetical protein ACP5O2_10945 [Bacteroidales bacterium]
MRRLALFFFSLLISGITMAQNQNLTQDVCQGVTENYYVDNTAGSSYVWSITPVSGGNIASGQGTHSVNIEWTGSPGVYTVSVVETDANNCVGPTRSVTITVHEAPVPSISGPLTACTGTQGIYSITGSGSSTYAWSVTVQGSITSGVNTNSATINWISAGTATVTVVETIGICSATANYSVTVNATPAPSITGVDATCLNSTEVFEVTLNAGSSYNWSVSGGVSIIGGQGSNQLSATFNVAGPQTVTIEETANGCTGTDTQNVTVHPLPNTSAIWHN